MTRLVLLDAGPLGLLTRSPRLPEAAACYAWLRAQLASGARVLLPEIADYEVRRELLRLQAHGALRRLDALHHETVYLPLSTPVMLRRRALGTDATGRDTDCRSAGTRRRCYPRSTGTSSAAARRYVCHRHDECGPPEPISTCRTLARY